MAGRMQTERPESQFPASALGSGLRWESPHPPPGGMRVRLLDGFQLASVNGRITMPGSAERLLALLSLTGRTMRRTEVAGTLWPAASESRAFGSLRSAVSRLGEAGRDALRADAVDLVLAPGVSVDLRSARAVAMRLLGAEPPESDLSGDVVAVLSRELLPGWYDDWVLIEAEDWRQLRLHALEALARHLCGAGRFAEAALAARASVRAEPLRESAHATLISVHLAEGNRSEARRQLERLRALLGEELGLEPSAPVLALFRPGDQ